LILFLVAASSLFLLLCVCMPLPNGEKQFNLVNDTAADDFFPIIHSFFNSLLG